MASRQNGVQVPSARALRSAALIGLVAAAVALAPFARVTVPVPLATTAQPSEEEGRRLLAGLLGNVYHAFDHRDESDIYDTLERSAAGELLTQIYLETRRALELQNQGGARAKIQDVELLSAETARLGGGGFVADCQWIATGSVGHWGHIHQRRNRYEARLTVRSVDGAWKITDLELLDEERL
jgi:hypothetical protein